MAEEQKIYIDLAEISAEAALPQCPEHPNATATGGYGLAGGGCGAYMMCDECGRIFSKVMDSDD